jgi:hypothetical protein
VCIADIKASWKGRAENNKVIRGHPGMFRPHGQRYPDYGPSLPDCPNRVRLFRAMMISHMQGSCSQPPPAFHLALLPMPSHIEGPPINLSRLVCNKLACLRRGNSSFHDYQKRCRYLRHAVGIDCSFYSPQFTMTLDELS